MYVNSKRTVTDEQNERHKRLLASILKEEGNKSCADCKTRNPTWASVNLGVFVCLTCSGIHRSLGVHISQVRSCNLDTWLPKQVEFCRVMGNVKGNRYWEARLPKDFRRPPSGNPNPELAAFIRAKYVDQVYAATDAQPPTIDNYLNHPYGSDATDPVHSPPAAPPAAATRQVPSGRTPTKLPQSAVPAPTVDLLGGFDDLTATCDIATPPFAPPQSSASSDPFGSFVSVQPAAAVAPTLSNILEWTDFHAAAPPAASSPALSALQGPTTAAPAAADVALLPSQHSISTAYGGNHQRSHSAGESLAFGAAAAPATASGATATQPSRFGGHSKALSAIPPELDSASLHFGTGSSSSRQGQGAAAAANHYRPHSLSHHNHHNNHNQTNNHLNHSNGLSKGVSSPTRPAAQQGAGAAGFDPYGQPPDDLLAGLTIHQMMESMSPPPPAAAAASEDPFQFSSSATTAGDAKALPHGRSSHHKQHHNPFHHHNKATEEILRLFDTEPSTGTEPSTRSGGAGAGGAAAAAAGASVAQTSSGHTAFVDDPFGDFISGGSRGHSHSTGHAMHNGNGHLSAHGASQVKEPQELLI